MRLASFFVLVALLFGSDPASVSAQAIEHACDAAAAKAEIDWNVPTGVLSAVGTVESGRVHGPFGAQPWPWTINAAGRGYFFKSKEAAIDAVLGLMQRGYPYIDIGCFQIDIAYHPDLFRSLDEAFDPERNAQAAARLLALGRARAPDWATAVANYHSATPELGGPYLQRVRAALPGAKLRGQQAQTLSQALDSQTAISASPSYATLPRVIYSEPSSRNGRRPATVLVGNAMGPPVVVANAPTSLNARR